MNLEMITKVIKAIVPLVALAGYELQPEQVDGIMTVVALVLSLLYALEAKWKSNKGSGK